MAQLRTALSILVIVAVQSTAGQMMMVPPMVARVRHHPNAPHIIRVVRPMIQQPNARIITSPSYTIADTPLQAEPKEHIDEKKLHARIKELEILKQNIVQKQLELDDKIVALDEQALSCHKQIDQYHEALSKLDELERHHSAEQIRLEQLIQHQRMAEYQERIEQERLERQKAAVEEWNNVQKERQREENSELAAIEEPATNPSKESCHLDSENTSSKPMTPESDKEVQIQRPMSRHQLVHKHDQPDHSTSLQVVPASKNPAITPSGSKTLGGVQVMKRGGVHESANRNVTSA
uniref:Uncharacterized protein n=1 Tax=Lygus hesperus TaxID=30085 RepID=A0A0K8SF13_LYGHE